MITSLIHVKVTTSSTTHAKGVDKLKKQKKRHTNSEFRDGSRTDTAD